MDALTTDLYHVDAAYVSWRAGQNGTATFDLYTRSAPFGGGYLLVAGLEQAIAFVRSFRYSEDDLAYLATIRPYEPAFLAELRRLRFTGEVVAMAEGSVAFAPEPLLRVTAPFREALLLESGLLHAIGRATLIATKAARVVGAAAGLPVADFALRRAAEPYVVSRSAAIGGCASTSFLGAARRYGLDVSGTVPHALIQAFATEEAAFRAIAEALERYSLLLDTYDVGRSVEIAAVVAQEARQRWGHELSAVRLDSGDLDGNSRQVRQVLDAAGLDGVRIVASGDLDEFTIADLVRAAAPIDGFGVGTSIGVGAGSVERRIAGGALGAVYKLVWYDEDPTRTGEEPRIKLAGAKSTWPGLKQVVRLGLYEGDIIQREDEPLPANGAPLLSPVVIGGEVVEGALPPLSEIRQRAATALAALPERFRALESLDLYPVVWSAGLQELRRQASEAGWQEASRGDGDS